MLKEQYCLTFLQGLGDVLIAYFISLLFYQMESEVYLLSHLRGKAHQEAVKDLKDDSEPVIIDAPPDKMDAKLAQHRERQKSLRKRCKKIRSRMAQR